MLIKSGPLYVAGHDLIAIEKPFAPKIQIAIHAHKAAVAWRTKHLHHCPRLAHNCWKRPIPLPNMYPIPAVEVVRLWLRCCFAHWLLPFCSI